MKQLMLSKPVVTAGIFLILLIPLSFIEALISERADFHSQAVADVSDSWTGAQKLLGPVLVVDYERTRVESVWNDEQQRMVERELTTAHSLMLPAKHLTVEISPGTQIRYRGIHGVPVYSATVVFDGSFEGLPPEAEVFQWALTDVYLWLWVTDQRGFTGLPELFWDGKRHTFAAGGHEALGGRGLRAELERSVLREGGRFGFQVELKGTERLEVIPSGESASYQILSDWPHPGFIGRYLPDQRDTGPDGFTAIWHSTVLASNVTRQLTDCARGDCGELLANHFGVVLLEPVNEYLQAQRAVKYGFLFILLTFAGVLMTELLQHRSVHPLQYGLIGAAMALFYLMLIAFSEHLPFFIAYLLAMLASTGLLTYYGLAVLGSQREGLLFGSAILALYGVLYVILSAEDTALLMGTLLSLLVLTLLMVVTRDSKRLTGLTLLLPEDDEAR